MSFQSAVTQYGVIVGAANKAIATVAASATAGQVLQSGGASANPSYSTATLPSTATGTGKILRADGTNWVATTATFPDTAGTSGKTLISDGTNFVSSTPTFPNASATSRKIIVSDGTNWVASTETYAVPGTTGNILTSDGTNWTSAAPAAGGGFVPTLTYIGSGTAAGATVDFTGLSSTYKGYRFYLNALATSATDIVIIRCSTDNGSNYDSSAIYQMVGSASGTSNSTSAQTGFPIQQNANATVNRNGYVDMYFNNTANAIVTFASNVTGTTGASFWSTGIYNAQANVNAIRFTVVGANNLSAGTIYQYGIS